MNAAKRRGRPSAAWDATERAPTPYKRAKAVTRNVRKKSYGHWPTHGEKRGRCRHCTDGQSNILREKIDVRLCLNKERNCFKQLHM